MRIVPFPGDGPLPDQEAWTAELDAALHGESASREADAWRVLCADIRSLAPAMTPAFERRLVRELERRGALRGADVDASGRTPAPHPADTAGRPSAGVAPTVRAGVLARLGRGRRLLASHRGAAVTAAGTAAVALIAAVLIAGGTGPRPIGSPTPAEKTPAISMGRAGANVTSKGPVRPPASHEALQASPLLGAPSAATAASSPGRQQQLAASLTLGADPASLQSISDQVAQQAARDGGYVQTSNVQVQQRGTSEATLTLRLPSARLAPALAAISRLAPVRAENQSLQDITDEYAAARQRLSDAEAERTALLHALAAATSEGQIDSLRERLSSARGAIARAQSALNAVSQRASTAVVEVTIVGNAPTQSEGLTLHRGLHDAGRVLLVALIVILIAAAILVPLALVLAVLAGARGAWLRNRRERVLSSR
jgi:Domain of unknown function (DUF4349)